VLNGIRFNLFDMGEKNFVRKARFSFLTCWIHLLDGDGKLHQAHVTLNGKMIYNIVHEH
jgi:hypothetical protein